MVENTPLFPPPEPVTNEEWERMGTTAPPEEASQTTYAHLSEVPLQTIYHDSHFPLNRGEFFINPGHAEEAYRNKLIDPNNDLIIGIQKAGERRPAHAAVIPIGKLDAKLTSLLQPFMEVFKKVHVADKTIEQVKSVAISEEIPSSYREKAKEYLAHIEMLRNSPEIAKVTGMVRLLYHEMNTHLQIPLTVSEFVARAKEKERVTGKKEKPMISLADLDYKDASALFGIVEATKLILNRHPMLLQLEVGKLLQERIGIAESVITTLELTDPRRGYAMTPLPDEMVGPALAARAEAATFPDSEELPALLDQT